MVQTLVQGGICSGVQAGGGGGGVRREECPPETFDREISADVSGKEREGKLGKWNRKKENRKREGGNLKIE